nr:LOB domain-containing protein 24-like [Aegilops tauschii subsp. strangulata]
MSTAGDVEVEVHEEDREGGGSNPGRCAACKYLRRRCAHDCVLAPYFPAWQPHRYASVHRVFGASNVARLLQSLPVGERAQAAEAMAMEAQWRVEDPVYGCAGIISRLQEEIPATQCELARTRAQLAIVPAHGAQLQGSTAALPPQRDDGHRVPVTQMQGQGQGEADDGHRVAVTQMQGKEEGVPLLDPDDGQRVPVAQMQGQGGEAVTLLDPDAFRNSTGSEL